jgi:hypothetical protein
MVLVKVYSVMMLTTSITTTSRMLSVLANSTMTVGNVAPELPGLLFACAHVATKKP